MDKQYTSVDLPAVLAGTAVALAISIVLLHFGSVLGLAISPDHAWDNKTVTGQIITINLWTLWVQVLSSIIGGYVAGRIRTPVPGSNLHEREMRDGIHGLAVWAFATVLVAIGAAVVAALASLSPEASATADQAENIIRMNEKVAIIVAFSMTSSSLVSAVAAWWAATKGGDHRDESTDLSSAVSFRPR
jgi:hypothetical protein